MYGLKLADIQLNRKMLSELAGTNPEEFKALVDTSKEAIAKEAK
jgi:large subunit ribosomal protein L20